MMRSIARLGDRHSCPLHGPNAISTVRTRSSCDARPIATVGDLTACGATILTGTDACVIDGRHAAVIGSVTSHGGVIVQGSVSKA